MNKKQLITAVTALSIISLSACTTTSSDNDDGIITRLRGFDTQQTSYQKTTSSDGTTVTQYIKTTTTPNVTSQNYSTTTQTYDLYDENQNFIMSFGPYYYVHENDGLYMLETEDGNTTLTLNYEFPLTVGSGVDNGVTGDGIIKYTVKRYETIEVNGESHYVAKIIHTDYDGDTGSTYNFTQYFSEEGSIRSINEDGSVSELTDPF